MLLLVSPLARKATPVPSGRCALGGAIVLACLAHGAPAAALQPLADFLGHARAWNPDNRSARATVAQRDAELSVTAGNLEPSLQVNGIYTRNEFEVGTSTLLGGGGATPAGVPNLIIQPQNQLDANATLTVPILNVASWDRRSVARATMDVAEADQASVVVTVAKNVTRSYFVLQGYEAVLLSATRNLDVTRHNVQLTRDKKESGTASELDVQRSLADQARAEQSVTAAHLNVVDARRDLLSLTGIEPEPASTFPDDDLHEEGALDDWMSGADRQPSVKSAVASRVSAEKAWRAARSAWIPTVQGIAEEKLTNATAFAGGHSSNYLLQLTASWRIDNTLLPQMRAQEAMAEAARAREDKARQSALDSVYRDFHQIKADIEASRSARVQVQATRLAASLAEDRYTSGVATQLDVLQARQDAFAADVARIQADADLAYARAALRLDAGHAAAP